MPNTAQRDKRRNARVQTKAVKRNTTVKGVIKKPKKPTLNCPTIRVSSKRVIQTAQQNKNRTFDPIFKPDMILTELSKHNPLEDIPNLASLNSLLDVKPMQFKRKKQCVVCGDDFRPSHQKHRQHDYVTCRNRNCQRLRRNYTMRKYYTTTYRKRHNALRRAFYKKNSERILSQRKQNKMHVERSMTNIQLKNHKNLPRD